MFEAIRLVNKFLKALKKKKEKVDIGTLIDSQINDYINLWNRDPKYITFSIEAYYDFKMQPGFDIDLRVGKRKTYRGMKISVDGDLEGYQVIVE